MVKDKRIWIIVIIISLFLLGSEKKEAVSFVDCGLYEACNFGFGWVYQKSADITQCCIADAQYSRQICIDNFFDILLYDCSSACECSVTGCDDYCTGNTLSYCDGCNYDTVDCSTTTGYCWEYYDAGVGCNTAACVECLTDSHCSGTDVCVDGWCEAVTCECSQITCDDYCTNDIMYTCDGCNYVVTDCSASEDFCDLYYDDFYNCFGTKCVDCHIDSDCTGTDVCVDNWCVPPCTDECIQGQIGCSGIDSRWTCGEAGDGDDCLDQIIIACNTGYHCDAGSCVIDSPKDFEIVSFNIDKSSVNEDEDVTATILVRNNLVACNSSIDDPRSDCNWMIEFGLYPRRLGFFQPSQRKLVSYKKGATFDAGQCCAGDVWTYNLGIKLDAGTSETINITATTPSRNTFVQCGTSNYAFDIELVPTTIIFKECGADASEASDWETLDALPLTCINPGTEVSNGLDDDCNGEIDDGIGPVPQTCTQLGGTCKKDTCANLGLASVSGATDCPTMCCKEYECISDDDCMALLEKCVDGKCKTNPIIWMVGLFFLAMFAFKMMMGTKKK